tara:strand:+ start:44 stop:979 length:936 start_codon:yes stop_codon:yes gene_type:complete
MSNKIKSINFNHSFIFFLFCNFFSLILIKFQNATISPIICLILILIVGVSHGSLDHLKGRKLLNILNIRNIIFFYLAYIFIVIIVISAWILFPVFSLISFLIIASFHFGKEDTQFLVNMNTYLYQFLYFLKGSLIILLPLFFHFNETIDIFKLLLIDNEAFYITLNFIEEKKILQLGIITSTLSSIFLLVKNFELKKFCLFFDYFSLIIINYYFTPLIAFTIYFCFLHSIRHSITLMFELNEDNFYHGFKVFVAKATPLTLITCVMCIISIYFLEYYNDLDSSILKVIFIGLASLTFPHILLEYFLEKNEK